MYISQIIFLSHAVFVGEFMANLYDYVIEKKETLAYCMYYFVIFDHGLSRMAKLLDRLLNSEEVDHGDMVLIKSCVAALVTQSIEIGTESKTGWEDTAEGCNSEIWKEVMFALRKVKGKPGGIERLYNHWMIFLWATRNASSKASACFLKRTKKT